MKSLLLAVLALSLHAAHAAEKPTSRDLAGKWEGPVTFGKFKFNLILRVATNDSGGLHVTLDLPEQGQTGIPVDALLFNAPDIRLEIDGFGTAYNGKINPDLTQIDGEFEEGPGGRPEPLIFKRSTAPEAPEAPKSYTFAAGESPDIRGYWKGEIEAGPGVKLTAGINIGRLPEGTFRATLDIPEQGAKDTPASAVSYADGEAVLEWRAFQATFRAKLSDDGKTLAGNWVAQGRTNALTYSRIDAPVELLPPHLNFVADAAKPDDVRGTWEGVLETPGGKLRIVVRVGSTPDGRIAGTLASPDQGGREIPASSAAYGDSNLKMEFRGIRGKYEGKVSTDGKTLEGKWEQFGPPMQLKLKRSSEHDKKA